MLQAVVPRNLRVRASVQVAGQRFPARGFLLVVGLLFLGGMAVVFGADLQRILWLVMILALAGLVVIEGRLWGRSSPDIVQIVWRQVSRPSQLRRMPVIVTLPAEPVSHITVKRRPRWMEKYS